MTPKGVHSPGKSAGQGRRAQAKWPLLKVIEDIREPLGLKGTTVAVLRAVLSYIRSDEISETRHENHVCFASNASLAKRAHVSIQTVERHVAKLVALGLLTRVSSGNGKRWARRDVHGRIVFATGLSVLPLHQRHEEFLELAEEHREQVLKLTLLRDTCAVRLAELVARDEECGSESAKIIDLKTRGRSILRRKPNSDALIGLLSEIIEELSERGSPDTKEMRDSDLQIEGHKETYLTQSVEKAVERDIQVSERDMQQCFPKLCAELRFAPSQQACERHMQDLSDHLGFGALWLDIKTLGPALSFMLLGYVLERVDTIQNPKGYAWRLMQELQENHDAWQSLLRPAETRLKGQGCGLTPQHRAEAPLASVSRYG